MTSWQLSCVVLVFYWFYQWNWVKQTKFQEVLSVMLTMTFLFGEHALSLKGPPNQDRLLQPILFRQWQQHPHWWKIEGIFLQISFVCVRSGSKINFLTHHSRWPGKHIFFQAQILSCVSLSHPYFTVVQGINTGRKPVKKKQKEGRKQDIIMASARTRTHTSRWRRHIAPYHSGDEQAPLSKLNLCWSL